MSQGGQHLESKHTLFKKKVKCHRRGSSSNTSSRHQGPAELCGALRALKRVRHEHREPLRFVRSWKNTGSEYEHEALLIIDPRFPLFPSSFLPPFGCVSAAAPLAASEIGLCFHVCCYGESSPAVCALSLVGVWVFWSRNRAQRIFHLFIRLLAAPLRPWKSLGSGSG